jgi:uncharacterized protein (TIGR02271 family)
MTPRDWIGRPIADIDGVPYGTLEELFVGRTTGEPEFAFVDVEGRRVAVPLTNARAENDVVVLPLDPNRVRSAPTVQRDVTSIPPQAGEVVLQFFGLNDGAPSPDVPTAPTTPISPALDVPAAGVPDVDAAEVTVSEEELVVDTEQVATERVRLRKVIVEEDVTVTVTLRREELRVEREPLAPDTKVERANGDGQLTEGALEFVLFAEEPVVSTRLVPVERIRVARDTVVEHERITGSVRKERAEVDNTPINEETHPV